MARKVKISESRLNSVRHKMYDASVAYVKMFCRIMDYDPTYASYVGVKPDPFGVVEVCDQMWSMTDMFYVISRLEHWVEVYGSIENVREVAQDWYWWSIGESEKWPRKEDDKKINLDSWLMGLRPADIDTSDEYKAMRAKEIEESAKRIAELKGDIERYAKEDYGQGF